MQREPIFNIPTVVVALLFALAGVHLVRTLLLSSEQDVELLLTFAFIPARYDSSIVLGGALPGGGGAQVWTFVSYALLHADWTHYCLNAIWLLPFGSALARRFGAARFLVFFAVTAAAGAAAHLATHPGDQAPVIGASAAISGTMAAAMRFAFQRGGPLGFWRKGEEADYRVPAIPLARRAARPARADLPGSLVRHQFVVRARFDAARRRGPGGRLAGPYRRLRCRAFVVFLVRSEAGISAIR